MLDYIRSDLMRYYGKYNFLTFIKGFIRNRAFRFQCAFRLCHGKGLIKILGLIMWRLSRTKHYIQLPRNTKVGYGLYIGHDGPIVVNEAAIIGNNVNLSQFTTIGSNENKGALLSLIHI